MNVLSLAHHIKRDRFPLYLGIRGHIPLKDKRPFLLGTRVMKWSEDTWFINLKTVLNYWKWNAKKEHIHILPYLEQQLKSIFKEDFLFSFAHHPWQNALLLNMQSKCENKGLVSLGTPHGDQFFRQQTFGHWQECLEDLSHHLPRSEQAEFNRMCGRWERFTERMQIERPFDLQNIDFDSIERRFGKWWGRLWRWSFDGFSEEEVQGDLFTHFDTESFPWCDQILDDPPFIERFLDQPLLEWDHMLGYLQEDMQKFLRDYPWLKQRKITKISWIVTLENFKTHRCTILFRNPHSLEADAPEFKTTLFQAYYSYLVMMRKVQEREDDLDYPIKMACIGWKLIITESLYITPQEKNLLDNSLDGNKELARLELENQLPAELEHYSLAPSFLPECSFATSDAQAMHTAPWLAATKNRPLFILKKPLAFEYKRHYRKAFLERVSSPWWSYHHCRTHPELGDRDYYILEDEKKMLWWVFCYDTGERKAWFKHGLFS